MVRNAARIAVVVFALVAGCSGGSGTEVAMVPGRQFEPATITISSGDTVTWVSEGDDAHTVTAYSDQLPDGASYFASGGAASETEARDAVSEGLISPGGSYEVTLEQPGTYEYFCIPHESDGMKGTIVVEG